MSSQVSLQNDAASVINQFTSGPVRPGKRVMKAIIGPQLFHLDIASHLCERLGLTAPRLNGAFLKVISSVKGLRVEFKGNAGKAYNFFLSRINGNLCLKLAK
jgi:hypothetical protein